MMKDKYMKIADLCIDSEDGLLTIIIEKWFREDKEAMQQLPDFLIDLGNVMKKSKLHKPNTDGRAR